jgi:glutamate racemase
LTVVAALQRALPHESIVYLGDTARVPYGTKSAATVIRYSLQIADFLTARGAKYLVAACNTASAHALDALADHLTIPVQGVVDPGARQAAGLTRLSRIGVIGTLGTVASGAYPRALHAMRPGLAVFSEACPLLVPLAEEGWHDHPVTAAVADHYLGQLLQQGGDLDAIVLGCTHYPLLRSALEASAERTFGHPVTLVDSASAVAAAVQRDLTRRGLRGSGPPVTQLFVTDESRFAELAPRFLGQPAPPVEHADL